jgi:hypothetical protein
MQAGSGEEADTYRQAVGRRQTHAGRQWGGGRHKQAGSGEEADSARSTLSTLEKRTYNGVTCISCWLCPAQPRITHHRILCKRSIVFRRGVEFN